VLATHQLAVSVPHATRSVPTSHLLTTHDGVSPPLVLHRQTPVPPQLQRFDIPRSPGGSGGSPSAGSGGRGWTGGDCALQAVRTGDLAMLERTLRNGSTASVQGDDGKNALHIAVMVGWSRGVDLLVRGGGAVLTQCTDSSLCTPLHYCALSGSATIARALLRSVSRPDAMAAANQPDVNGCTPLHHAAAHGASKVPHPLSSLHSRRHTHTHTHTHTLARVRARPQHINPCTYTTSLYVFT
jgi:hypothetical protein